jgi:dolichyl-phosphate-mannose--protein O-mannosyl transferase
MALVTPVIWWGFLLLLPVAIVDVVRRPTWRHALIFGGYLALFLPWFYIGRSQFIFYMLPAVPLMCLGICSALRSVPAKASTWSAGTMATAVVVAAALYMPLWLGLWIPRSWAEHLRLLHSWPF